MNHLLKLCINHSIYYLKREITSIESFRNLHLLLPERVFHIRSLSIISTHHTTLSIKLHPCIPYKILNLMNERRPKLNVTHRPSWWSITCQMKRNVIGFVKRKEGHSVHNVNRRSCRANMTLNWLLLKLPPLDDIQRYRPIYFCWADPYLTRFRLVSMLLSI